MTTHGSDDVEVKLHDPMLIQVIARTLFEKLIKLKLPALTLQAPAIEITADEQNAIRYVGGYILKSIRKKLSKSHTPSYQLIVDFITKLHPCESDDVDSDDSFVQYTTRWIKKADRGGLFKISDSVYEMFYAMEVVLRSFIKDIDCAIDIKKLHQEIIEDGDVQFLWALVCTSLDNDMAEILLFEIVKLWITLRGFAYASNIVEQYKECAKTTLQKKRALRKDLAQ